MLASSEYMSRLKRILMITDAFPPQAVGGIGRYCYEYGCALAALPDFEVHIFTPGGTYQERATEGMTVHEIQTGEYPAFHLLDDLDLPYGMKNYLHSMLHYAEKLHAQKPLDLIVAPTWNSLALPFVRSNLAPTVIVPVTGYNEMYPASVLAQLDGDEQHRVTQMLGAETALFQEAQYIQWSCEGIQRHVQPRLLSRSTPYTSCVIPFGLHDHGLSSKHVQSQASIELLFVGRLEHRKGIDLVLEAFVHLANRHPALHLTVIGGDTAVPYREQFLQAYAWQPILQKITFLGRVSDTALMEAYSRADIFIAPSRFESFGLIYTEAMMHGLPIVALREHQHLVEDGKQGLLADETAPSIAEALDTLILDSNLRQKLGKHARETFCAHYNLPQVVSRLASTYNNFIEHAAHHSAAS